ncbi:hypothetical protein MUY27_17310 [Mucilaginibacter sp. RS28]|uniref:Uncharacterized protein n=1 Tax=Mucilaginibacter straminoryzae TaxID=2932774 RepID=A0A9X1X5R8_9SPHI|nr:hypothetical protein [Mucilaginibacter straminoryzae]MCJ8211481.1 hypothetical protein [Mucilaginibacter straminoryzae]
MLYYKGFYDNLRKDIDTKLGDFLVQNLTRGVNEGYYNALIDKAESISWYTWQLKHLSTDISVDNEERKRLFALTDKVYRCYLTSC